MKPQLFDDILIKAGGPSNLAKTLGVSRQVVNGWKQNKQFPREHLKAISKEFKKPLEDLI